MDTSEIISNLSKPYSPFKIKLNFIIVPQKYRDILDPKYSIDDFDKLQAQLVSSNFINEWYEHFLPTPTTDFYTFDEFKDLIFNSPKFVRLNSLSGKQLIPFSNSKDAYSFICKSNRCQDSIKFMKKYGIIPLFAVRNWKNLDNGLEFRVFIYEYKIRAISINDTKICDIQKNDIINRCKVLFEKVKHNLPCVDTVMDVWLGSQENDIVIEFNSYGFWGISGAGLFDWDLDWFVLYGFADEIEVRI
jgi:hypothetical protein